MLSHQGVLLATFKQFDEPAFGAGVTLQNQIALDDCLLSTSVGQLNAEGPVAVGEETGMSSDARIAEVAGHKPLRRRRRSGSVRTSISAIRLPTTVKLLTGTSRSLSKIRAPAEPRPSGRPR